LSESQVEFASADVAQALDQLLKAYVDDFKLRKPFFLTEFLGNDPAKVARFIAGAIESATWSYQYETKARIQQKSAIPPNIQIQLPPGQPMPLIPGLAREYNVEATAQGWVRNTHPQGVTT
jgi:hypothetical protein